MVVKASPHSELLVVFSHHGTDTIKCKWPSFIKVIMRSKCPFHVSFVRSCLMVFLRPKPEDVWDAHPSSDIHFANDLNKLIMEEGIHFQLKGFANPESAVVANAKEESVSFCDPWYPFKFQWSSEDKIELFISKKGYFLQLQMGNLNERGINAL